MKLLIDSKISSKEKVILFGLAFLVKFSLLFVFSNFSNDTFSEDSDALTLYFCSGDANDYIDPVENLIKNGSFYFGDDNYAGRMPGFAAVYLPIRLLFEKHIALNLVIIIQTLLNCFSALFLFLLCFDISKNKMISFFCYFLFAIGSYISIYNNHILTESLAFSSLIFSTYHFNMFFKNNLNKHLIYSGLFICWLIFLRPFMIVTFVIFILILFLKLFKEKHSRSKLIAMILIFSAPFILFDGLWITRNAFCSSKFIPLQSSLQKGSSKEKIIKTNQFRSFICSFGGDFIAWHPGSHGMWFQSDSFLEKNNFKRPNDEIFPKKIFTKELTLDTLKYARNMYQQSWGKSNPYFSNEAIRVLTNFKENYKNKFPTDYYFISRLKILKRFLIQPYTYMLPYSYNDSNIFLKFYKIFDYLISIILIFFGSILVFILSLFFFKKIQLYEKLVLSTFWFLIFLFPIYFGVNEFRMILLGCTSLIFSFPIFYRIINKNN